MTNDKNRTTAAAQPRSYTGVSLDCYGSLVLSYLNRSNSFEKYWGRGQGDKRTRRGQGDKENDEC